MRRSWLRAALMPAVVVASLAIGCAAGAGGLGAVVGIGGAVVIWLLLSVAAVVGGTGCEPCLGAPWPDGGNEEHAAEGLDDVHVCLADMRFEALDARADPVEPDVPEIVQADGAAEFGADLEPGDAGADAAADGPADGAKSAALRRPAAADRLVRAGVLTPEQARRLRRLLGRSGDEA